MFNKVVCVKKKKFRSFKLRKLKKKWRFWRLFKFYFLRRKKKFFFSKIRWLFNQKRMIWHQLSTMYGKNIKNEAYVNHKSRVIFNSKFGSILCKLELRLNVLVLRMFFVSKLQHANSLIAQKQIKVNGIVKQKKYLVSTGDLITYISSFRKSSKLRRLEKFRRPRWYKRKFWRQRVKHKKITSKQIYFFLRKNFVFNFMEINYYYFSSVLLRHPLLGEISYRNKKQLLTSRLLQKIYFLY